MGNIFRLFSDFCVIVLEKELCLRLAWRPYHLLGSSAKFFRATKTGGRLSSASYGATSDVALFFIVMSPAGRTPFMKRTVGG